MLAHQSHTEFYTMSDQTREIFHKYYYNRRDAVDKTIVYLTTTCNELICINRNSLSRNSIRSTVEDKLQLSNFTEPTTVYFAVVAD